LESILECLFKKASQISMATWREKSASEHIFLIADGIFFTVLLSINPTIWMKLIQAFPCISIESTPRPYDLDCDISITAIFDPVAPKCVWMIET
jgi:hypothetical protein